MYGSKLTCVAALFKYWQQIEHMQPYSIQLFKKDFLNEVK